MHTELVFEAGQTALPVTLVDLDVTPRWDCRTVAEMRLPQLLYLVLAEE